MKNVLFIVMVVFLAVTLCACGGTAMPSVETETPDDAESVDEVQATQVVTASPKPAEAPSAGYEITDCRSISWVNSIGTTWIQTIVEITNTGTTNLYLSSGSYDIEDADGHLVTTESLVSAFPDVIAPGEKGYMYDETTLDKSVEGELTVIPREDVKEAKIELIRFPVTDAELSASSYGGLKLIGRVENNSAETESMVYVVVFLYNAEGQCIGCMFTIIMEDLNAGDKIGFEVTGFSLPDEVTLESVADYVVYAYPLQYQF